MTNTPRFGSTVQGCRHFLIAIMAVAVVGAGALGIAQAQQNTAYGTNALPGNTGSNNSAFGYGALFLNTTGIDNTGFGVNALGSNTSGWANTGIGYNAMPNSSVPGENTALGAYTLFDNFVAGRQYQRLLQYRHRQFHSLFQYHRLREHRRWRLRS